MWRVAQLPAARMTPVQETTPQRIGTVVVLMIYIAYAYVGMEWLFFVTKPSFMDSFDLVGKLGAIFIPALGLFLVCALLIVLFGMLDRLVSTRLFALLVPTVVLGSLFFLLADNFLYTTLGVGTIHSQSIVRFVILAVYVAILVKTYGLIRNWTQQLLSVRARTWMIGPAVACLIASIGMLGTTVATTDYQRAVVDAALTTGEEHRPNIIFLASDGIEARHLSVYGHPSQNSPFLETFAARTVLFENAFANAGKSTGSTTSMLSGKLPTTLKVGFPPQILSKTHAVQHLPATLRTFGYSGYQHGIRYYVDGGDLNMQSGFQIANGRALFSPQPGSFAARLSYTFNTELAFIIRMAERLSRRVLHMCGIRDMVNHFLLIRDNAGQGWQRDAHMIDAAMAFIEQQRQPFFMHLHLMGSHCCSYLGGKSRVSQDQPAERLRRWVDNVDGQVAPKALRTFGRYLDSVRDADAHFARFIGWLDKTGRLDNTLLIISSDHTQLWGSTQRIPLLVYFPDSDFTGRVAENVSLVDLAPTILDYMEVGIPEWMDGISRLPAIESGPAFEQSARQNEPKPILTLEKFQYTRFYFKQGGLSGIDRPGPPLYGVSEVGLIMCNQWKKVALQTGQIASGLVDGHTAPCPEAVFPADAQIRAFVARELSQAGFHLPAWASPISLDEKFGVLSIRKE